MVAGPAEPPHFLTLLLPFASLGRSLSDHSERYSCLAVVICSGPCTFRWVPCRGRHGTIVCSSRTDGCLSRLPGSRNFTENLRRSPGPGIASPRGADLACCQG